MTDIGHIDPAEATKFDCLAEIENQKLSRNVAAKRIGISATTLSQWLSGKCGGDVAAVEGKVERWLDTQREAERHNLEAAGLDIHRELGVTEEVAAVLAHAQAVGDVVLIAPAPTHHLRRQHPHRLRARPLAAHRAGRRGPALPALRRGARPAHPARPPRLARHRAALGPSLLGHLSAAQRLALPLHPPATLAGRSRTLRPPPLARAAARQRLGRGRGPTAAPARPSRCRSASTPAGTAMPAPPTSPPTPAARWRKRRPTRRPRCGPRWRTISIRRSDAGTEETPVVTPAKAGGQSPRHALTEV